MLMQIADTIQKSTSKSCHCIKNRIILAQLTVSFKPKEKFHCTDCLGICNLHLETVQPVTGIGLHKSER